jgi:hypothetical protein
MEADYSRAALFRFIDYLSSKGLMNLNTAGSRKAACNKVLGILDESEVADLRELNIDEIMGRFSNLKGTDYTPDSLAVYRSRVKGAVDDFISYTNNPLGFKTNSSSAGKKSHEKPKITKQETLKPDRSPQASSTVSSLLPTAAVNIMPIQLRADLTIYIQGLPFDLTAPEASKLANVIKAMAQTD